MNKQVFFVFLLVLTLGLSACSRNRLRDQTPTETAPVSMTTAAAPTEVNSPTESAVTEASPSLEPNTAEPAATPLPTNTPPQPQPSQAEALTDDLDTALNELEQLLDGMNTEVNVP